MYQFVSANIIYKKMKFKEKLLWMIFKILLALSVHVSPIFLLKFVDIKICCMQARKELSLFQGIRTTEKKNWTSYVKGLQEI